ncbi:nucleotidyl transferase AbiEii/AbiGii toxin family protein [Oxalobacteraceae bacterium]|nr:nucleotidyl transferase AbiEii/AbiGii toxin family protein [Oxalobacteraceae bacterium]
MTIDLAASIRARLLNLAKAEQSDFNQVLVRFSLERMLYRLSQSAYSENFLLKGALLFSLWYDMPHRHTRDADLLGLGPSDLTAIGKTFQDIMQVPCEDGIQFHADSLLIKEIRKDTGYGGARVQVKAELAKARCKVQIDIGFGDAVSPAPVNAVFPVLLDDLPAPRLKTYPIYTVIAEKLHAIASLGMSNTRMKDYLDLYVLLTRESIECGQLSSAIRATFGRRGTVQFNLPFAGLSDEFAQDPARQKIWFSFLKKNDIAPLPLPDVVTTIRSFTPKP